MNKKNLLSYLLCILTLVILCFFIDLKNLKLLLNVSIPSLIISIILAIIIYYVSGIQLYYIRKQFGISLKLKDLILLPIVGSLWSFILPIQGNLIFNTFFFKQRYNMKISESFSISIYLYLVTLCFTGCFALFFSIYNNVLFSWLGFVSILFIFNPLFVILANLIFQKIGNTKIKTIDKIQLFLNSTVENTNNLWLNYKFSFLIFSLNAFLIFLTIFWFYWNSKSLGFNLSFVEVGLISLIMNISLIVKITPGNLGITQLITASCINIIGGNPEQATLVTLFASAITIIIIFTIGLYGNFYYFKTINFNDLIKKQKY